MPVSGSIRKSSPVIVLSLLVLITALGFATIGNNKKDSRTLVGAVLYIFAGGFLFKTILLCKNFILTQNKISALGLATGVIFYISAVNDEVAHRKKPESKDDPQFSYRYGWAFFFAGSSFMCAMMAAVANISLYIKRYPTLDDMVLIVPGLEKKAGNVRTPDDFEQDLGMQNPTIIL